MRYRIRLCHCVYFDTRARIISTREEKKRTRVDDSILKSAKSRKLTRTEVSNNKRPCVWIVGSPIERNFTPLATLSLSASAAAAAAAAASLTTDPLAAEDLLLSWYSLYQPRPAPTAPGPMLAAMSTLMMPAAVTLAGHPLAALPPQPKPDLLTLPGPLPIAHLTLKAMNSHSSSLANGLGLSNGSSLCVNNASNMNILAGSSSNSNKAGRLNCPFVCPLAKPNGKQINWPVDSLVLSL